MATNYQQATGFSLPDIDYTLTKPVDLGPIADQIINWGPNQRARAIQKQEQDDILGGKLVRSEATVGPNGAITSGYADPAEMQLKRQVEAAKIANYGSLAGYRQQQAALGQGRLGVSQGNLGQREKEFGWKTGPMVLDDGTVIQPIPGGGSVSKNPSAPEPQLPSNIQPGQDMGDAVGQLQPTQQGAGGQDAISGSTNTDDYEYLIFD